MSEPYKCVITPNRKRYRAPKSVTLIADCTVIESFSVNKEGKRTIHDRIVTNLRNVRKCT